MNPIVTQAWTSAELAHQGSRASMALRPRNWPSCERRWPGGFASGLDRPRANGGGGHLLGSHGHPSRCEEACRQRWWQRKGEHDQRVCSLDRLEMSGLLAATG